MVARFPGLGDIIGTVRAGVRTGEAEFPTLPFWARLPLIKGLVAREIHKAVQENEQLVQRLRNYDRIRQPLMIPVEKFQPGPRQLLSATVTMITPEGKIVVSRIAFPFGTKYDPDEFIRRVASDVGDITFKRDPELTDKIRRAIVAIDWYVQEYRKI